MFLKIATGVLLLVSTISCSFISGLTSLRKPANIPVVRVAREPVEVKVYTIGELRPVRTAMVVAPPVAGGTLQIVHLVTTGTYVKQGDTIVEFDPSEQEYNLEQSQSQMDEADQQIKKMKADQAVRVAQEKVTLLQAQFAVQRAELKVKENDLVSGIEARKNVIDLEEARRKFEQLQRDIKSRASSDAADLAVQSVARTKAMLGMKLAQQNIDNMTFRAPIAGIVVLGQNLDSLVTGSGTITISSIDEIPEFKEGDLAYPGRFIGQIQEMEQMEITGKVTETERGSLDSVQAVEVVADSKPLKVYEGRIKSVAQSASMPGQSGESAVDYLESLSTRSFASVFEIETRGDPLNLGVTARVTIKGKNVNDALSLPRQALYQKEGKTVVYLRRPEGWEAREVKVKYVTESRAVIEGLGEGIEVALVNPDQQKSKSNGKSSSAAPILGGTAP